MAFMGKRKQYKSVVVIFVVLIGVTLIGSSIYYSFSGTGINANNNNSAPNNDYKEGTAKTVVAQYEPKVKADPNNIENMKVLANQGYFELGLFYFQKAGEYNTAKDTKRATDYSNKATAQFNRAIAQLEKVTNAPNSKPAEIADSLGNLATAYFYTNKVDQAISTVNKAINADPTLYTARINLAIYLGYGKNDYKSAIDTLNKIPSNAPEYQTAKKMTSEFNQALSQPANSGQSGSGGQIPIKR